MDDDEAEKRELGLGLKESENQEDYEREVYQLTISINPSDANLVDVIFKS